MVHSKLCALNKILNPSIPVKTTRNLNTRITNLKTAIVGASDKPERYANKAMRMLEQHGHEVILVHPSLKSIAGKPVSPSLAAIRGPIDTITMYVNPAISDAMEKDLKDLSPRRVIFNPGSENPRLARALRAAGVEVEEACTLVLLQTGQF